METIDKSDCKMDTNQALVELLRSLLKEGKITRRARITVKLSIDDYISANGFMSTQDRATWRLGDYSFKLIC